MLVEIYKGVHIFHDAKKDVFTTKLVVRLSINNKPNEYIEAPRLQKTRDEIDKFLNTAARKPAVKKGHLIEESSFSEYTKFYKVDVDIFNTISNTVLLKKEDGSTKVFGFNEYRNNNSFILCCKENDAIIANIKKAVKQIDDLIKSINCMKGKLIPFTKEHFTK